MSYWESELAAASPFRETARKVMAEGVRQHAKRAKRGVNRVQVFDLVIKIAFGGRVEFAGPVSLNQDFEEEGEKIEILFRRRKRERIDLEVFGL